MTPVTACACTGEPKSILDEVGMPLLAMGGVCLCPYCGKNPFGVDPEHPDMKAFANLALQESCITEHNALVRRAGQYLRGNPMNQREIVHTSPLDAGESDGERD